MASRTRASKNRQSQGDYSFAQIPRAEISRSVFNRSHGVTTAFDTGLLIPVYWDEALPGDTHTVGVNSFVRLTTPIVPVMDNLYLDLFFFSVPNRILWEHWVNMMGEQVNPGDHTDYTVPQVSATASAMLSQTIYDYFGIPVDTASSFNALYFRAYNAIYNEWFRSQDLIDSVPVPLDDGPDDPGDYTLLRRGKRHDYFTGALPFAQKGPAVPLPLGETAPVVGLGDATPAFNMAGQSAGPLQVSAGIQQSSEFVTVFGGNASTGGPHNLTWSDTKLEADLSSATATTINSLREAFQLQRMYERDARGGTRYTELLRSHFLVESPDGRQQRPEYLGGGSSRISYHPVAQTNSTNNTTPQGNLAAFATGSYDGRAFSKSFTEHSIIIGLASIRQDQRYQYGLDRAFSRQTRFDYFWPALQHLGEQEVLNQELYMDGSAQDTEVFGYQERWAEYRYKPSKITGLMRSYVTGSFQTLHYWHLAQQWDTRPLLNKDFIEENIPIDRTLAVTDEPEVFADFWFDVKSVRPMSTYSVPGLIDHF